MKSFSIVALVIAGLGATVQSCHKPATDTTCDSGIITLPADSIIGPTAPVAVGTRIGFSIALSIYNGCGLWRGLESNIVGNTITLRLKGQYKGCICTSVYYHMQIPYAYDPTQPGTYTLQVIQPNGTPKVHTFIVQ